MTGQAESRRSIHIRGRLGTAELGAGIVNWIVDPTGHTYDRALDP